MKKENQTCYICGEQATSAEHAPAKCFFPTDRRDNLITVGSCAKHNEETSKDDEYVRNVIAMSLGNNKVALDHFLQRCIRSFMRSPALLKITTQQKQNVYVKEVGSSKIEPTSAFGLDRDRIDLVLKKISYAVFNHEYEATWNRELLIGTEFLRTQSMQTDGLGFLIQGARKLLTNPTFEGNNPEVFQYTFLPSDSNDIHDQLLIMKFYEGFEVWVFPQPGTTGPQL